MTTYHKQYPGAGNFVRVIAKTDDCRREIAQCSGPVIGAVNSFTQATEDADRIVAALNAYEPVDPEPVDPDTTRSLMGEGNHAGLRTRRFIIELEGDFKPETTDSDIALAIDTLFTGWSVPVRDFLHDDGCLVTEVTGSGEYTVRWRLSTALVY